MSTRKVIIPREISILELQGAATSGQVVAMEGATMGTYWRAQCNLPIDQERALVYNTLADCFALVVQQMSHFDSNSCLSKYNRASPGSWCEIPNEFASVLQVALDVAARSEGAYDPAAGRIIDAYGFGANPPSQEEFSIGAVSSSHIPEAWRGIELKATSNSTALDEVPERHDLLQPGEIELNLSSIAKGYAVDLAAERLLQLGVKHFLLEIGGELRGHGCKPDGMPWWCLLEQPDSATDTERTIVALCGLSVATSGDLVQHRTTNSGERLSHIVDPRNGRPASDELALVTVFHESCCVADAWATALYVLGLERGLAMAQDNSLAVIMTSRTDDGYAEHLSPILESMLD